MIQLRLTRHDEGSARDSCALGRRVELRDEPRTRRHPGHRQRRLQQIPQLGARKAPALGAIGKGGMELVAEPPGSTGEEYGTEYPGESGVDIVVAAEVPARTRR